MTVEGGAVVRGSGPRWAPPSISKRAAFASFLVQLSLPYGGWFTAIPRRRMPKRR